METEHLARDVLQIIQEVWNTPRLHDGVVEYGEQLYIDALTRIETLAAQASGYVSLNNN